MLVVVVEYGWEGEREERTKGTVDLNALDTVFLSISWDRHI